MAQVKRMSIRLQVSGVAKYRAPKSGGGNGQGGEFMAWLLAEASTMQEGEATVISSAKWSLGRSGKSVEVGPCIAVNRPFMRNKGFAFRTTTLILDKDIAAELGEQEGISLAEGDKAYAITRVNKEQFDIAMAGKRGPRKAKVG